MSKMIVEQRSIIKCVCEISKKKLKMLSNAYGESAVKKHPHLQML